MSILLSKVWGRAPRRRRSAQRPERGLLLGRERVLDPNEQRHLRALDLALDRQRAVHLRQHRRLVHRGALQQLEELLRLGLHAPLQIHELVLRLLNRFRDGLALLGPEPDALLLLHDQLGREELLLDRLVLTLLRAHRRRGGQREHERDREGARSIRHEVLPWSRTVSGVGRRPRRVSVRSISRPAAPPKLGTVRSSSPPEVRSRKSVGASHRTLPMTAGPSGGDATAESRPRSSVAHVTATAAAADAAASVSARSRRGRARTALVRTAPYDGAWARSEARRRANESRRSRSLSSSLTSLPPSRVGCAAGSCRARSGPARSRSRWRARPPPRGSRAPGRTRDAALPAGGAAARRARPAVARSTPRGRAPRPHRAPDRPAPLPRRALRASARAGAASAGAGARRPFGG